MDSTLAQILTELYNAKLQLTKAREELEVYYKQSERDKVKKEKKNYGNDRGRSS